jgi:septum site-determining protein MinC
MAKEYVTLKGTKDGVRVILDTAVPFNVIFDEIIKKFESASSFFSKGKCTISFENRHISDADRLKLEQKISEALTDCEFSVTYDEDKAAAVKMFTDIKEGYTKFYEGTVRSGRLLQSEGNLVVLGDINPGAEVVAAGNIVVMGSVRGIVHAGCTGNREAFIVALNLSPTQVRIADIITRPPDDDKRKNIVPEKAYIRDETIYIEEYFTK